KLENEQYTGSFKARGSLARLMQLKKMHSSPFAVTASSGNHGLGFARALKLLNIQGKIFLPENATSTKVDGIQAFDVPIEFHGKDPFSTEQYARKVAEQQRWHYVSPYNDPVVIAGQGTIAKEIIESIPQPDNLLATVGGGGLISGLAAYFSHYSPKSRIIGCQPANSPEMSVTVRTGHYQTMPSKPTLSDGSAGGF